MVSLLIYVIFAVIVLGICIYAIQTFMPGPPTLKNLLNLLIVLVFLLVILRILGLLGGPILG